MRFSEKELKELEVSVASRLSEKRFRHTLGVVNASLHIAKYFFDIDKSELHAAALLHDVAKEIPNDESMRILLSASPAPTESDLLCPPVHHSLTAPEIIKRDFPDFATENILSAVRSHTTASPDMSLFDSIIFISDYVEEGRVYPDCVSLRDKLYSTLSNSRDADEARVHLDNAIIECLDKTILFVIKRGIFLHEKTVSARNAYLARRPMPLKPGDK